MEPLPGSWAVWIALLVVILTWYLLSRPRGIPPGPRGLPFVGNLHQLSSTSTHLDFMKIGQTYGEIFSLYIGTKLVIVLNSHKLMKEAFVNMGTTFADRPPAVVISEENGAKLFAAPYNEQFVVEKKFAVKALRFAGYGTKAAEDRMLTAIDDLSNILLNQESKAQDLARVFKKTCARIMCRIIFSKQYTMDDPELEYLVNKVQELLQSFSGDAAMADAIPRWLAQLFFSRAINQTKTIAQDIVEKFCINRIKEHHNAFDPNNPRDFVDYYIAAGENGPKYTNFELARHCPGFFVDAIDTTAYLINWNIFYLAEFPTWQIKLQQEIDEVVGNTRAPSTSDRAHLPLVEAFQQEVLRISSVFNISLPHKPLHDATLGGYHIPKGASILGNFWGANQDPAIWPEPAIFKPGRHIDQDGNFVKTDKIWIFGQGRRMCLGEQLVKLEVFMFIARLLQHFTFKFPSDLPHPDLKDVEEGLMRRPPPFKICPVPR